MKAIFALVVLLPMVARGKYLGGRTPITLDETDPNVQFAMESINNYYTRLGDSDPRSLVEIKSVLSQVVAGVMYYMELRVRSSTQDELCTVDVWSRPWLRRGEPLQTRRDPECIVMPEWTKRELVGSYTDITLDETDPNVQFAMESINNYYTRQLDPEPRSLVEIKSVLYQVVAGIMYHMELHVRSSGNQDELCTVDMWSRTWLTEPIQTWSDPDCVVMPELTKRGLVGGNTDVNLDETDPNVVFAIQSINNYYTNLGDSETRYLKEIKSVQSQIVAGVLYHLELQVETSHQEELCKVDVWSRPWLGDDALQLSRDPQCKLIVKRSLGGPTQIDTDDEHVQKALMFATTTMNARENFMFHRKPVKVAKVTSQVVAGIAYHFSDVDMAPTNCTKSMDSVDLDTCKAVTSGRSLRCSFDVYEQAWMTPVYTLDHVKCDRP